jgi:tetratricopeptide (TPR) repeat protein
MRVLILIIFCLYLSQIHSQLRGGEVESNAFELKGKTYALIVGVSNYQNPNIPDLKYADVDALMFKEYLISTGVAESNIQTLINEQATNSSFWSTLNYLSEQLKDGDRFYIYFSGHGDVENKTIVKDAYLLPYDSPYAVYPMGAIGILYLKSWIATFSSKGVQTIFIADACRSGNLIGGREGMEATANILKDKWEDEIKIVSCQPGELSLEGEQWGGGRGLFSFELINGLSGSADKNRDDQVSLRELNLYLLEKVPDQAGRNPQNPMLFGNYESTISAVNLDFQKRISDDVSLKSLIKKGILDAENKSINSKGIDNILQENKDNDAIKKFNELIKNIENNNIVSLYTPNAYSLYKELKKAKPEESKLLETSKLLITERVLKNVQNFVLFVLGGIAESEFDPKDIGKISFQASILRDLIGDEKLIESGNFSRILFAEACRSLKAFIPEKDLLMPKEVALAKIDTAISYEKGAVYLNCLKGLILEFEFGNKGAALKEYEIAVEINPNFRIARNMLLRRKLELGDFYSVLEYTNIQKPSELDNLYSYIAHKRLNNIDSSEIYFAKILSFSHNPLDPKNEFDRNIEIGSSLMEVDDEAIALMFFEKALVSFNRSSNDESLYFELAEDIPVIYYNMACCKAKLNKPEEALKDLYFAMENGWSDYEWMMDDPDLETVRKSKDFSKMLKENSRYCYNLSCKFSLNGKIKDSEKYLKHALEAGFSDFEWIMQDADLVNLRNQVDVEKMIRPFKEKRK